MNRRGFLRATGAGVVLAGAGALGWRQWAGRVQPALGPLPLLPMTDLTGGIDGRIALNMAAGRHDFGTGVASDTLGINAPYLGPALRVKQGQVLPFDVANGTDEVSTLHWHGLHIPGPVDGGPHQEIAPGAVWSPDVPITQRASMNWFHSHMHGRTARQTYGGLAGVMLIEDDASLSADLPQSYGVDDFTLVLQDKLFDGAGRVHYSATAEVFEDGFAGDLLVVNGALAPRAQEVPNGLVRLRILNACNGRFLRLSMARGPLQVIACEGGFLASRVEAGSLLIAPGERYEILVDLRGGGSNSLMVGFEGDALGALAPPMTGLTLTGSDVAGFDAALPEALAVLPPADASQATGTRSFTLQEDIGADLVALAANWGNVCGGGAMAINGQPMKMDRIDEEVRKGETEIWRVEADGGLHPFHIHGCSFRILSQSGAEPPAYAQGWKDMVHVDEGWSEVLVRFDYDAPEDAPYMYHCHILEHEDCGMMGQFTVS